MTFTELEMIDWRETQGFLPTQAGRTTPWTVWVRTSAVARF